MIATTDRRNDDTLQPGLMPMAQSEQTAGLVPPPSTSGTTASSPVTPTASSGDVAEEPHSPALYLALLRGDDTPTAERWS